MVDRHAARNHNKHAPRDIALRRDTISIARPMCTIAKIRINLRTIFRSSIVITVERYWVKRIISQGIRLVKGESLICYNFTHYTHIGIRIIESRRYGVTQGKIFFIKYAVFIRIIKYLEIILRSLVWANLARRRIISKAVYRRAAVIDLVNITAVGGHVCHRHRERLDLSSTHRILEILGIFKTRGTVRIEHLCFRPVRDGIVLRGLISQRHRIIHILRRDMIRGNHVIRILYVGIFRECARSRS